MEGLMFMEQTVTRYYQNHRNSFEDWEHGEPKDSWFDKDGVICISYEDGSWWHYSERNGFLAWW